MKDKLIELIKKDTGYKYVPLIKYNNELFRILKNGNTSSVQYDFFNQNQNYSLEEAIYSLSISVNETNCKEVYKLHYEPVEVLLEVVEQNTESEENITKEFSKKIVNT